MIRQLFKIFILAFLFDFLWENAHSFLYVGHHDAGYTINQFILLRATLFDALYITLIGAIILLLPISKIKLWPVIPLGFIMAAIIEMYALATKRWEYNDYMPIIPILNIGLTPFLQLGLLSYLTLKLTLKNR